ncbi:2OG-Fe(II) oxygenase family protein [Terricaulis silvestris]|uniref:Tetratricopeptide repeat protein n=1 Tax=Terricaulis silvestris TaxID=2686094 RepID=A0A6I6MIS3_9CAUL|nr:tetratricopeptide repeat protein [Terricaulis silvestris]QGZ95045.1 tetratricopeptide repeat protein [Terricaulis silvestris]
MRLAEAAAFAQASRELLNKGDAVGAEQVLSPVIGQLGSDAKALHLMGLIKRARNQLAEAERYFRAAISHAFNEGGYYNDLGVVLQARGEYKEAIRVYRAALALVPEAAATRVNVVRCHMAAEDYAGAEEDARVYIAAAPGPEAWTLLGQVQRAQEKNEEALISAETALKYAPTMRGLQLNHATALDRVGRAKEARQIYATLADKEVDSQELALNYARSLFADDKKKEAEALLESAIATWPASVTLHGPLARMRELRGAGEAATELIEAEIARRPKDISLRLAAADALHRGDHHQKALRVLDEALRLAPDSPPLLTAAGIVLDELERPRDGLKLLRRVAELDPKSKSAQRNLLSTLIRAGMPEEALSIIRTLREDDPDEQYLIACEALAYRVLGEPGYATLCDYDRMIRTYEIPAPRGFFTVENFNAALADVLRRQHRINAHPLDQHIHHGSQTGRSLLSIDEPNITAFRASVESAVRDYISRLKSEDGDPLSRRRKERYRFSSMWSVRLGHEGYQPNHVHDHGWISSAYFVSLLPYEKRRDPKAGWLKFGEPNRPVAGCTPERFIEPKLGTLVLFPSYFWHGTVPFEGSERLSAAFDVAPA